MRPLLNRIVFHGIETCRGLLDEPRSRVRSVAERRLVIRALATVTPDRLAPELSDAGLTRIRRTLDTEVWVFGDSVQLHLAPSGGADADSADAVAREYAILLTRTADLGEGCAVRVSTIPAQLAMLWSAHTASRAAFTDSGPLEDMIEIVVLRRAIVEDVANAPAELRSLVAQASRAFLAHDGCLWVLRRALPDARLVPAVAMRARDRFVLLAEL